ncbi:MAG: DUF721 domain-containing protein [Endomicrobium sp.]|jgi:hypothetical protein|nr:DUF721 domain-containing protein [Endomicrobium sp.]
MTLTKANKIIELLRQRLGLKEEFFIIERVWNKEVGIEGLEIMGYKNGTIFTKTQSSVVASELTFCKKEIIKKINQYIGVQKIKNIKVKIKM